MDKKYQYFFVTVLLSLSQITYYAVSWSIHSILDDRGMEYTDLHKSLLWIFWISINLLTIVYGYRSGKEVSIPDVYKEYLRYLGYSWVTSILVFALIFLVLGNEAQSYLGVAMTSVTTVYRIPVLMFSSSVLGWLTKDGVTLNRVLNQNIVKLVILYNFAHLMRLILNRFIVYQSLSVDRQSISWTISLTNWIMMPIWVWYIYSLYNRGRTSDLPNEYGAVLYTFWVSSMALSLLSYLVNVLFYYFRSGMQDLFTLPIANLPKIITPTLNILSLPFAIFCYAYFESKYRNRGLLPKDNDKE